MTLLSETTVYVRGIERVLFIAHEKFLKINYLSSINYFLVLLTFHDPF